MLDPRTGMDRHLPPGISGAMSAFAPRDPVGIIAGFAILVVLAIASGAIGGIWLVGALGSLILLVALIWRAMRAEMRREDAPPTAAVQASLPDDSDVSDEERREAMRRYTGGRHAG